MFYSSAIYSAFFRDVTTEINQATESNDFSALFNTVLNPYALLSGIPAVYLGPFLFFAFAIGWSLLYAKLKGKKGIEWLKHASIFTLFLGLAIAADFLIAWKIESFNHELKTMNGLASPDWKFYTEFMFWGVFILGLGSYVVWKMLTEAIIIEKDKVNPKRLAHLLREKLQLEITLLEEELLKHKEEEQKLLTILKNLNNELNKIDIKLENIYKGVPDLVHSQDAYYRGWIKYVSSHPNKESLIEACEQVYHEFKLAMTPREHIEFIPRSLN
ncbi:MAG: hypothetical protein IPO63_17655 [Bacteroidetes bacterium]|nr:hypothetical protein [Bacteroidota bacterium]